MADNTGINKTSPYWAGIYTPKESLAYKKCEEAALSGNNPQIIIVPQNNKGEANFYFNNNENSDFGFLWRNPDKNKEDVCLRFKDGNSNVFAGDEEKTNISETNLMKNIFNYGLKGTARKLSEE